MARRESIYESFQGNIPELSKPIWVPLYKDMFEAGTVGHTLFPADLEGRVRSPALFDRTFKSLRPSLPLSYKQAFDTEFGNPTVRQILHQPLERFKTAAVPQNVLGHLSSYMEQLVVTPHGRLLKGLKGFGDRLEYGDRPIPVDYENEFIQAVESQVVSLRPIGVFTLKYRYGLSDGLMKTKKDLGVALGLTTAYTDGLIFDAVNHLIRQSGQYLQGIITTPPDSFARQVLGVIFTADLAKLHEIKVKELGLTEATLAELSSKTSRLDLLWQSDQAGINSPLSTKAYNEFLSKLLSPALMGNVIKYPADVPIYKSFDPEYQNGEYDLTSLDSQLIEELELTVRSYNALKRVGLNTIGEIIKYSPDDLLAIRNCGRKNMEEILTKLANFSRNNPDLLTITGLVDQERDWDTRYWV